MKRLDNQAENTERGQKTGGNNLVECFRCNFLASLTKFTKKAFMTYVLEIFWIFLKFKLLRMQLIQSEQRVAIVSAIISTYVVAPYKMNTEPIFLGQTRTEKPNQRSSRFLSRCFSFSARICSTPGIYHPTHTFYNSHFCLMSTARF